MSMTYSLFEWVRESLETLLEKQPETIQTVCEEIETKCSVTEIDDIFSRHEFGQMQK